MIKKHFKYIAAVTFMVAAVIIYYLFSPENTNYFPECPFHYLTGLDCPGCGSQRALHYLLHFDIKEAFLRNPLLVISIPYLIVGVYFEYMGGRYKFPRIRKFLFGKNATIVILIIVIAYWIGRNVVKFI